VFVKFINIRHTLKLLKMKIKNWFSNSTKSKQKIF